MNRKYLMAVVLGVAFFAGIVRVRAEREQQRKVAVVRVNLDVAPVGEDLTLPQGRVVGFSCTAMSCYVLVEVAK